MITAAPNRLQGPGWSSFARATALLTAASMQLFWVGIMLCAVECAKGACPGPVSGAAEPVSGHCGHSSTKPRTPAGGPHSRNCPASYLYYLSAWRGTVTASQMQIAAPLAVVALLPHAPPGVSPHGAGASFGEESSSQFIAAVPFLLPLRI